MSRLDLIGILVCLLCANYYVHGVQTASTARQVNITLGPRTSPWTPITSKNRYGYHLPLAASESRSFSTNSESSGSYHVQGGSGVPMIKHRENGATVGLDIPDSNLRLLLDIDELAAKPSADAIKLKVIERDNIGTAGSEERAKERRSPSSYARQSPSSHHSPSHHSTGNKPLNFPPPSNGKQYKIGFIRASDIHSAINSGVLPPGSQPFPVHSAPPSTTYVNGPSSNIVVSASTGGPIKYSQPIPGDSPITNEVSNNNKKVEVHKYPSNFVETPAPQLQAASLTAAESASKTNTQRQIVQQEQQTQSKTSPSSNGKTNPVSKSRSSNNNNSKTNSQRKIVTTTPAPVKSVSENVVQQQQREEQKPQQREGQKQQPREGQKQQQKIESPKSQKKVVPPPKTPASSADLQQQKFTQEDEQQKQAAADVSDEQDEVDVLKSDDQGLDQSGEDNDDGFGDNVQVKDTSSEQTSSRLRAGRNSLDSDDDDEDDFDLVRITPRTSSSAGQESCNAISSTFSGDSDSMTIKEFAARLGADAIFSMFPGMEDQMQNVVDFANAGYTIFLPSNEAVSRLPKTLINRLKSKPEELKKLIENHVSDEKQSLKSMKSNLIMNPRASNSRLRVTKLGSSSITVNGQRVTQMDQRGPMGGSVNVLDGVLYPTADKNVMETLKSCNRFDGFVTLAEGTGLGDTLSKGLLLHLFYLESKI